MDNYYILLIFEYKYTLLFLTQLKILISFPYLLLRHHFCRYGVDDGDDSFEDEARGFGSEDELDQLYQRNLQQQLFLQRLIQEEVQKQSARHCCCCHVADNPPENYKDSHQKSGLCSCQHDHIKSFNRNSLEQQQVSLLCDFERKTHDDKNRRPEKKCRNISTTTHVCNFCSSNHLPERASKSTLHQCDESPMCVHSGNRFLKQSKSLNNSPYDRLIKLGEASRICLESRPSVGVLPVNSPKDLQLHECRSNRQIFTKPKQFAQNQNLPQQKMPSKIITTSDEICVVIDS